MPTTDEKKKKPYAFADLPSGFERPGGVSFNDPAKSVKPVGPALAATLAPLLPKPASPVLREGNPNFGRPAPPRGLDPNFPGDLSKPAPGRAPNRQPVATAAPAPAAAPVSRVNNPNFPGGMPRPARGLDPNRPGDLTAPAPAGAPVRPPAKPGGFGRGVGNVLAGAADVAMASPKMALDLANRTAIGARNIYADAVGDPRQLQPEPFNYTQAQDALTDVRQRNAAGVRPGVPATAKPAVPATPAVDPVAANAAAIKASEAERAAARQRTAGAGAVAAGTAPPNAPTGAPVAAPGSRSLSSGRGEFGEPIYDNASIARLDARNAAGAQPGTVNGQGFGGSAPLMTDQLAIAQAAAAPPPQYSGPNFNLQVDPVANAERKAALAQIQSDISALGSLNSNGKRQIYAELVRARTGLTEAAFDQSGDLTREGAGLNARGGEAAQGNSARSADQAAQLEAQAREAGLGRSFDFAQSGEAMTGEDGTLSLVRGGRAQQVLDAAGNPYMPKQAAVKDGTVTPEGELNALIELSKSIDPIDDPEGYAQVQQEIGRRLSGSGKPAAPPAAAVAKLKADPKLAAAFDEKFGRGAAAAVLGK